MSSKPFFTIRTSDFAFTNNELTFLKKHLHGKYPSVMNRMIDQTRQLMRVIQTLAKSETKLTYYASRSHPQDTDRYVVSEMLYGLVVDGGPRAIINIEPIADKNTEHKDQRTSTKNLRRLIELLEHAKAQKYRLSTYGNIGYRQVVQNVLILLEDIKQEVIVQDFSFVTDVSDAPHLSIDLRHRTSYSHHITILFDFFEPIKATAEEQDTHEPQGAST